MPIVTNRAVVPNQSRLTRSDTVLENAFVPDQYVARFAPAGAAGVDPFVLGIFAWALMDFGNIYYGLAKRALDQTITALKTKSSLALTRSMAYHPEAQHAIAEMVIELESIGPSGERGGGLVEWRRSRRAMAIKDLCRQIPCRRGLLARRGSWVGRKWRLRDLSLGGLRTLATRCAPAEDSSCQFLPHT